MTKSILALTLALGFSTGLAVVAHADQTAAMPSATPPQLATMPWQEEGAAVSDYNHGVNPQPSVRSTGVYDQEDFYRDSTGRPLPGYAQMFGEDYEN
jgi:hypothetical protein